MQYSIRNGRLVLNSNDINDKSNNIESEKYVSILYEQVNFYSKDLMKSI